MVLPGNRVIDLIISSRMEDFENNQGLKDLDRLLTTGKGVIAQGLFPSAKAKDGHWLRDIDVAVKIDVVVKTWKFSVPNEEVNMVAPGGHMERCLRAHDA